MPDFQDICYYLLKYLIKARKGEGVITYSELCQALKPRLPSMNPALIKKPMEFRLETGLCQRKGQPVESEIVMKITELGHEYYARLKEYQEKPRKKKAKAQVLA